MSPFSFCLPAPTHEKREREKVFLRWSLAPAFPICTESCPGLRRGRALDRPRSKCKMD